MSQMVLMLISANSDPPTPSYVDKGMNPDAYARNSIQACVERNKATRGKLAALAALRDTLQARIASEMPDTWAEYCGTFRQHVDARACCC